MMSIQNPDPPSPQSATGLLGDTPQKSYVTKLDLFNHFAAPELQQVIAELPIRPHGRLLDAGCGTGMVTGWLAERAPNGLTIGVDLAAAHVAQAHHKRANASLPYHFLQADICQLPLPNNTFDLIWCSNAVNHLRRPVAGLRALIRQLRRGGRLVLGQSVFLPDMFFAWDARLEREVTQACRQYYRDKYGLSEKDNSDTRNLLGWMQRAGLQDLTVRTIVIERTYPLTPAEETYFVEGVFRGYWDYRVQPYLSAADWQTLQALCDPQSPQFCLRRPDFHHIQTYTTISGTIPK